MGGDELETWDLWIPDAAATGVPFARGRLEHVDQLIVHSAPHLLTAEIRAGDGTLIASGRDLARSQQVPMTRLRRQGDTISREDFWPSEADHGTLVLLPGGEVGRLRDWWHREDRREWRWTIEFYNRLD
jgi:hypothetical protein